MLGQPALKGGPYLHGRGLGDDWGAATVEGQVLKASAAIGGGLGRDRGGDAVGLVELSERGRFSIGWRGWSRGGERDRDGRLLHALETRLHATDLFLDGVEVVPNLKRTQLEAGEGRVKVLGKGRWVGGRDCC